MTRKIDDHTCEFATHVPGEYTVPSYDVYECVDCGSRFAIHLLGEIEENRNNLPGTCKERQLVKRGVMPEGRRFKMTMDIEVVLRHEDASHDKRVKDELESSLIFAATEQDLLYEVDGKEYHAPT